MGMLENAIEQTIAGMSLCHADAMNAECLGFQQPLRGFSIGF